MKALKVVHVANRAEKHLGKKFYSFPFKVNNGLIRNGHNVYWFSDRDVARTSSLIPSGKLGRRACNRKLIELCDQFRPDVLLLGHADLIGSDTLLTIRGRNPGLRIAQYNIDGLYAKGNVAKILGKQDAVDATYITTAGEALRAIAAPKAPARFIPNPVDAGIDSHRNWDRSDFAYDLFFIGAQSDWIDPLSLRAEAFRHLPQGLGTARIFLSSNLWGSALLDAVGDSKLGLCFNQRPPGEVPGNGGHLYLCSSDRISTCMGNGMLTFVDACFGLSELYGADTLVEVAGWEEFVTRVDHFLRHDAERRAVAQRGWDLSHREFNEVLVTRYILETLLGEPLSHPYRWPTLTYSTPADRNGALP